MKRTLLLVTVLALVFTAALPVWAAEDTFVPSITYKDGPEILEAKMNGEDVTACLEVTSILQAQQKQTDIPQENRDLLMEVYQQLLANEMQLPLSQSSAQAVTAARTTDYVVRELIDVSWRKSDCVDLKHTHDEWLEKENTTLTVAFDAGIPGDVQPVVLVYVDGQWVHAKSVENNGNKTLTVVFEDICPVAICVPRDVNDTPADTGDALGRMLWLWVALLVICLAAAAYLLVNRRKFFR